LIAIIDKMMAKKPADRYQHASEIIEALEPWTSMPIAPPPNTEMPQLSPAAQANEGTDVNLGMTPVGNVNTPSSRRIRTPGAPAAAASSNTPSPARNAAVRNAPARNSVGTTPSPRPRPKPAPAPTTAAETEPEPEAERGSSVWVIVVTFLIAAGLGIGLWWTFLRPGR